MKITINYRFIVGIDISKRWLDIYLLDRKSNQGSAMKVSNTEDGFGKLNQWLESQEVRQSQAVLCSEHTGRYGEPLLAWSSGQGWSHAVLKTTALAKVSQEHHRKTDRYDAKKIAEYGRRYSDKLRPWKPSKASVKQIKRLRNERKAMVSSRASLRQKLTEADYHDASMEQIKDCWKQQIRLLSQHIDKLEEQIKALIKKDHQLAETYERMRTAPGIGKSHWYGLGE